MFLQLANLLPSGTDPARVFLISPFQLSRWLDDAWAAGGVIPPILGSSATPFLGDPKVVTDQMLPAGFRTARPSGIDLNAPDSFTGAAFTTPPLIWDHLMYAYLVESTGVFEIFSEVVRRLLVGETLVTLSSESVQWLRATEDLFFKDAPNFAINSVASQVRPNARANRRNAYWRMFGMDLPHQIPGRWGSSSDTTWKTDVGPGVNTDFREKWTELLRQVWLGIENKANGIGPKPTDPTFLVLICEALRDMMNNRRRGGQLAREEFAYVAAMSWFDLTIRTNTPIVRDLQAVASSPADRLAAIGHRVGMNPAARSRELIELAQPASRVLRAIELRLFDTPSAAEQLFNDPLLSRDMANIIDNWQSATGERVKGQAVVSFPGGSPNGSQPLRIPTPARSNGAAVPVSLNGAKV
jgi:hypothetical protein